MRENGALAAALLAATPALAQDRMTVMPDGFANPDHGPIIVAREQGSFADRGLEVEIIAPADPSDPPKTAAAGRAGRRTSASAPGCAAGAPEGDATSACGAA